MEEEKTTMKVEKEPQSEEEKKMMDLEKKVEEQKAEIEDNEDRIKRLMAEFENFKKRSDKERQGLYNSVMGDVVTSLLPVIDNLEKAVEAKLRMNNIRMVLKCV